MKRRRRKNPTGAWDVAGGVAAFAVPLGAAMVADRTGAARASAPGALGVQVGQAAVVVGGLMGAGFTYFAGVQNPSFARGYTIGSLALAGAAALYAAFGPAPQALPASPGRTALPGDGELVT